MRAGCVAAMLSIALGACAGRDPMPVATSQPQDIYASCTQLQAEIQANNAKVTQLADEQGWKVAQNVAAGVAGIVIWPIWFAMDFKGGADKDVAALQARQQYLAILASERCAPAPRTATRGAQRGASRVTPQPPPPSQLPPSAYYQPPPTPLTPGPPEEYGTPH